MLEEVPEQHKGAWVRVWSLTLERWEEARTEGEKDTALLWLGFWAQGLLRKPSRGGKQGRSDVARRFTMALEED